VLFLFYAYRSLIARRRANALTVLSVVLFVAAGSLGLAFHDSLERVLLQSAPAENVLVIAKGAPAEAASKLELATAQKIALLEGVQASGASRLAVRELVTRMYLDTADFSSYQDPVPIRGIDERSLEVHRAQVAQGAAPQPGGLEVMLGRQVARRYPNVGIGYEISLPAGPARVVGIFTAGGGPFEAEIWTPRRALELHLNTKFSSSMTLVAAGADRVPALVDQINNSKELRAQAAPVAAFREDLAGLGTITVTVLVLLVLLSLVVTFAIATTMNAAVVMRLPELAALAAIGIRRSALARIVLVESVLLAAIGALAGVAVSALLQRQIGEVSMGASPVEITATWPVMLAGIGMGLVAGLIGGLAPAIRVHRLNITSAMR
jgi:ABC-type antimicrobial peptide transport system permease subunit